MADAVKIFFRRSLLKQLLAGLNKSVSVTGDSGTEYVVLVEDDLDDGPMLFKARKGNGTQDSVSPSPRKSGTYYRDLADRVTDRDLKAYYDELARRHGA